MPRKTLVLVACILGSGIAFLDGTVVNVALPAIARRPRRRARRPSSGSSRPTCSRSARFLLIGGSLGDIFGRRRVFVAGVVAFGSTSLLCAMAPTHDGPDRRARRSRASPARCWCRARWGSSWPRSTRASAARRSARGRRGRASPPWSGRWPAACSCDAASWRWVFLINVPLGRRHRADRARALPDERPAGAGPASTWRGATLCGARAGGPVFALIEQPRHGWSDPLIWVPLVAGRRAARSPSSSYERRDARPDGPARRCSRGATSPGGTWRRSPCTPGSALPFFFLVLFLQQIAGYSRSRRAWRCCR